MKENQYMRSLKMLHYSMCLGIVIFLLVSFYLVRFQGFKVDKLEDSKMLQIMAIVLSAGAVFFSNLLFKKRVSGIPDLKSTNEKLTIYRSSNLILWAMLEGAAILCIIFFLMSTNYAFMGLAAMILLIMVVHRPTLYKTVLQTGLTEQQLGEQV